MMASHNKAKKAYSKDSIYHTELTKDRFTGEASYYMAYDAKGRKNKDIYFRMSEESE